MYSKYLSHAGARKLTSVGPGSTSKWLVAAAMRCDMAIIMKLNLERKSQIFFCGFQYSSQAFSAC